MTRSTVLVDLYFITRLLERNGIVLFDDSANPRVAKVLRFRRTNLGSTYAELNLDGYRADRGRSFRFQAAKLMRRTQLTGFQQISDPRRNWDAAFVDF